MACICSSASRRIISPSSACHCCRRLISCDRKEASSVEFRFAHRQRPDLRSFPRKRESRGRELGQRAGSPLPRLGMHTSRIALVVSCEGACHTVPSPHVGEGQGEGWRQSTRCEADPVQVRDIESAVIESRIGDTVRCLLYPSPCPSPTWGQGNRIWKKWARGTIRQTECLERTQGPFSFRFWSV